MIPFLLRPSGKDYVWGGTRLRDEFHKILDVEPVAETWECSTHQDGPCFVASGPLNGQMLANLLHGDPSLLGTSLSGATDVNGNYECSIFGNIECSVFGNNSAAFSVTMMHHFS